MSNSNSVALRSGREPKPWLGLVVVALITSSFPGPAGADECVLLTGARIFGSAFGDYGFTLTFGATPTNRARGELFTHRSSGQRQSIWRATLVNVPASVYVSELDDTVITVDTACRFGFEHAVVVYGPRGRVLSDYALEQLLSPAEIKDHVRRTVSWRLWTEGTRFEFDMERPEFVISLPWGRIIRIGLATGHILP